MKKFVSSENFVRLAVICKILLLCSFCTYLLTFGPLRNHGRGISPYNVVHTMPRNIPRVYLSVITTSALIKEHTEYLVCGSEAVNGILVIYTKL